MAIRPTQLRAGFILLLFTLLFIASNSLVTKVYADSPEESFKVTPIPFWDIETENTLIEYGTNSQDISFAHGIHFEDFSQIDNWYTIGGNALTYENGIGIQENVVHPTNYYKIGTNIISEPDKEFFIKIKYRFNASVSNARLYLYELDDSSGDYCYTSYLISDGDWHTLEKYGDAFLSIEAGGIESVGFSIQSTVNSWKFEIEYLSIFKGEHIYAEDFSNINDWTNTTVMDASTDGNILSIEDGEAGWNTYYTVFGATSFSGNLIVKSKVNTSSGAHLVRFYENADATGSAVQWYLTESKTSFYVDIFHVEDVTFESIAIYYSVANPRKSEYDYLILQSDSGQFNVSIPIERFTNHKLEFMIDTQNLAETTKLDFGIFQNDESMNYDFSLENQTFTQRDFEFDYSEYNYLRFTLDLKYSTNYFKLSCYDENNTKIFGNIIFEQVRKVGNSFKIQSDNLGGWFYLYYFTGNVDYSTVWTETIIDLDTDIDYSMLSSSCWLEAELNDHEIIYNRFVSNFQFLRTNMYIYTYFSSSLEHELGLIIDIQFYYPNGSEFYRVNGKMYRVYSELVFFMKIYEGDIEIFSSASGSDIGTTEIEGNIQFGIWRTQDNHIGAFYNCDETNFPDVSEFSRFMSNKTLENFQANITITHFSENIELGYRNFVMELDGFELGYGRVEGVAEPHFSTTWWDSIPFLGPIINAFMLVGNAIILALELGLLPITIFLDSIFGAIGGIAGTVWVLFESALSDLGISIDALASDVFGFFDSILTSISDIIDDVYSAIINLNDNFVAWVIDGITDALIPALVAGIDSLMDALFALWEYQLNLVGTALGWGDIGTFLFDFTDSVVLTIPSWLEFIISINIMMVDIFVFVNALYAEYGPTFILYGCLFVAIDILTAVMTLDLDIIGDCLIKYVKVIAFIAEFMLSIISTVLNAIWGILPF